MLSAQYERQVEHTSPVLLKFTVFYESPREGRQQLTNKFECWYASRVYKCCLSYYRQDFEMIYLPFVYSFFRFFLEDCYRRTVIVDGEEVTIDVLDTACRVS